MPSTPHGANLPATTHNVNANGVHRPSPISSDTTAIPGPPSKSIMATDTNGHFQDSAQPATDKNKRSTSSPHKLMIGVPPAATPNPPRSSTEHTHPHNDAHNPTQNGNVSSELKGKQKQLDPIHTVSLEQLQQELPLEETDLVSLAALVERLANYGYESLQNLAETLPSLPSSSKRAKIFSAALDVRKQFIKLLVLARWSKDVPDLQKARNIIALLSEQQWQHEDVFAGLTDIRKILPNARMRNADLPTAIDVLQTGTYRRLPASIKDMAVAPPPLTDQQALAIVARLQDALRTRMACRELVPAPLSDYSIHDAKVHFHVRGLFRAQLTASSGGRDQDADRPDQHAETGAADAASSAASADDRWWLLDLSFDATPTGSCAESSLKLFPKRPKKAYRERLRVWGDQELAPRSQATDAALDANADAAPTASEPPHVLSTADTQGESKPAVQQSEPQDVSPQPTQPDADPEASFKLPKMRDAPLVRLFAFLQERALHYQMDILQHQAYELCRLNWGSNLRIETAERPRRLTVHYWTHAQGAEGTSSAPDSPAAGGSIQISLVDLPDQAAVTKTLAEIFDDDAPSECDGASPTAVKRRGLRVVWNAHASVLSDSETSDLDIDPHNLDIEATLSLVIKRHTAALLRGLQRRLLVSDHPVSRLLRPEDCTLCVEHARRQGDEFSTATEATSFNFLRVELHGRNRQRAARTKRAAAVSTMPPLRLSADAVTGRLLLDSEAASVAAVAGLHGSTAPASEFTASILTTRPASARLSEASDRINGSIDALFDVLYRLEVFARVQDWERMASYLGLRTVRKLSLRPQDLAKFGSSVSTDAAPQLFIPLRKSFPGYFLALQPSELAGARIALVYVVQMPDPSGAPSLTVQSIEWLDRVKIANASKAGRGFPADAAMPGPGAGKKRKAASAETSETQEADAGIAVRELSMEELADVHSYCIALVSYFRVEQQLRMRGIPYLHVAGSKADSATPPKWRRRVAPATSDAHVDARDNGLFDDDDDDEGMEAEAAAEPAGVDSQEQAVETGVAALVPTLCLRAADVLGPAKAHLTKPNVSLRVCDWDESDKTCVQVLVKLRMKSRRFRALHEVVAYASTSDQHAQSAATWIDFDDATCVLAISTRDVDNCIPIFYMQWERVMRMVMLTREVLNASRAWQQRALRARTSCKKPAERVELCRFQLDTVVFSYGTLGVEDGARKLLVRVRWRDPKMEMAAYGAMPVAQNGGYVVEFGSAPVSEVEAEAAKSKDEALSAWFDAQHAAANPHDVMAFELRRTLNVAARSAAMSAVAQPQLERLVWKGFLRLLRDTLPVVREVAPLATQCLDDPEVPELEIRGATWFRLRFHDRYALDIRLATRSRLVIADAARALFRHERHRGAAAPGGMFAGSDLLRDVLAGNPPSKDGAPKDRSAADALSAPNGTTQFDPIPKLDEVLHKVEAALRGDARVGDVWDLRRALLVSLTDAALVHKLMPQLVQLVAAEVAAVGK